MKKTFCLSVVPMLLLVGCMDASKLKDSKSVAQDAIAAEDQASTNLYLNDMVDSAVSPEAAKDAAKDGSVADDTKDARLKAMATKLLDRLDADDSGSLSKDEFLALAKGMDKGDTTAQSAEELAAKQKKLEETFTKFSGGDELSLAELQEALKSQGDRIGKFRNAKHKGQHQKRVKEVTAEVLAKFDTNKDGKLDETEMAALRASDKETCHKGGKGGKGTGTGTGTTGGKGGTGTENPTTPGKGTTPPVITIPTTPPAGPVKG